MENWKSVTIGEIAKLNTTSYSEKEKWEYVNYLDTGSIVENKIYSIQYFDTQKDSVPSRAKRKVRKNSIIYSTVRPNQRHYGIIKTIPENFLVSTGFTVIDVDETVADADFVYYSLACDNVTDRLMTIANNSTSSYPSITPDKEEERSFLYAVLDSDAFYIHSVQRATSSTGSRKRIQPEVSASFKFAYPNDECIIDAFCDLCTPILKKKKDLLKESQDLRALKDWLLPFIMNGQFSISD